MTTLVCPEYELGTFCSRIAGKDLAEILEVISAEISTARRLHREKTRDADFRVGSRGRKYCDDLQTLLKMFMGSCPRNPSPEFVTAVMPLVKSIRTKWRVTGIDEFIETAPTRSVLPFGDPLVVVVSSQEVQSGNIQPALSTLSRLIDSPEAARVNMEKVDIAFFGYDQRGEELFEIPEVRHYVYQLDERFPYWLFFLSKRHLGLQCLIHCLLLPHLTDEAKAKHHPKQLESLLLNRWFPAMNQIAGFAGLTEDENRHLTNRVMTYISRGRLT